MENLQENNDTYNPLTTRREALGLIAKVGGGLFAAGGIASLVSGLTGCATTPQKPDFYPQAGAPHTITYTDKETGKEVTAFDLTGDWEAQYRSGKEIVRVTQKNNKFTGEKTIGGPDVRSGQMTIKGSVVNGNIIYCEVFHPSMGWVGFYQKIDPLWKLICM